MVQSAVPVLLEGFYLTLYKTTAHHATNLQLRSTLFSKDDFRKPVIRLHLFILNAPSLALPLAEHCLSSDA